MNEIVQELPQSWERRVKRLQVERLSEKMSGNPPNHLLIQRISSSARNQEGAISTRKNSTSSKVWSEQLRMQEEFGHFQWILTQQICHLGWIQPNLHWSKDSHCWGVIPESSEIDQYLHILRSFSEFSAGFELTELGARWRAVTSSPGRWTS